MVSLVSVDNFFFLIPLVVSALVLQGHPFLTFKLTLFKPCIKVAFCLYSKSEFSSVIVGTLNPGKFSRS